MRFFLASTFFILALPCLITAGILFGRRLRRWARVTGRITAVNIRSSKHLTVEAYIFYHQIFVAVEYTLAGTVYKRRINPQTTADDLPLAEKLAETRYRPDNTIRIYYNPAEPQEITLRPDEDWEGYVPRLTTAGIVCIIVGVLLAAL